jgi:hypothetical protein
VQHILGFVRSQGGRPVWGKAVVDSFGAGVEGAGNMDWTKFFKHACNEHGLLRYKRTPVTRSSTVYFALGETLADAASFEVPGP